MASVSCPLRPTFHGGGAALDLLLAGGRASAGEEGGATGGGEEVGTNLGFEMGDAKGWL